MNAHKSPILLVGKARRREYMHRDSKNENAFGGGGQKSERSTKKDEDTKKRVERKREREREHEEQAL
jgi:hypothetical protein